MSNTLITFYLHELPHGCLSVQNIVPDRDWSCLGTGVSCWIIQTYLRLKEAGWAIELASVSPPSGIVIAHADHMHKLLSSIKGRANELTIVCVRADRAENLYADIEIVQNPTAADNKRTFFMPLWPQPGLIIRNRDRGSNIANIAFKGEHSQLNGEFHRPEWVESLHLRGIEWISDTVRWQGPRVKYENISWNDYSKIDLVLAVRNNPADLYNNKPASKLLNSWLAGVPALLGAESAYRQLRKSPLDFIEITSAAEALDAIDRLRQNQKLYQDMVENGIERAKEYSPELICDRWANLLFEKIPMRTSYFSYRIQSLLPIGMRYRLRKLMSNY